MTTAAQAPEVFAHLIDLAADVTGAFVVHATDDFFAEKENLLKPGAPEWRADAYTDKGKWMDGWESQRRKDPYAPDAHDWCVVRLGVPGRVQGFLVDTTHFKGNAPQAVALEGLDAPPHVLREAVLDEQGWFPLVPKTDVKPDFRNVLAVSGPAVERRVTHVRLRQYPDGGVARLRVYGTAAPEPRVFWAAGSMDLAALDVGGTVVQVSDQFFGPPSNLLLPGRGVNMGDGWETKRRRTEGTDWAVIRLARRGVLERLELDTHFFKGNAPRRCLVEVLDEERVGAGAVQRLLREPKGWTTLVPWTALDPHRRHLLLPARPLPITHVRVHIWPHGGVNRMRFYGAPVDTAGEANALADLRALGADAQRTLFLSFNGSAALAAQVQARLPQLTGVRALFHAFEGGFFGLAEADWLEAFAAHPKIGDAKKAASATTQSASWSSGEQAGVQDAEARVKAQLAEKNAAYAAKFGFIYIVCATGKSAAEMLELLEARLENDRGTELENAAREQALITRLRIEKWLASELAKGG